MRWNFLGPVTFQHGVVHGAFGRATQGRVRNGDSFNKKHTRDMLSRGCYRQRGGLAVCFSYKSPTLSQTLVRITGTCFHPHCCGQEILPLLPTCATAQLWLYGMTQPKNRQRGMGFRNWGEGRDEGGMKGGIKIGPQRTIPHQPPEGWLYQFWEALWTPTVQQKYNMICSCKLKIFSSPHWKKKF